MESTDNKGIVLIIFLTALDYPPICIISLEVPPDLFRNVNGCVQAHSLNIYNERIVGFFSSGALEINV